MSYHDDDDQQSLSRLGKDHVGVFNQSSSGSSISSINSRSSSGSVRRRRKYNSFFLLLSQEQQPQKQKQSFFMDRVLLIILFVVNSITVVIILISWLSHNQQCQTIMNHDHHHLYSSRIAPVLLSSFSFYSSYKSRTTIFGSGFVDVGVVMAFSYQQPQHYLLGMNEAIKRKQKQQNPQRIIQQQRKNIATTSHSSSTSSQSNQLWIKKKNNNDNEDDDNNKNNNEIQIQKNAIHQTTTTTRTTLVPEENPIIYSTEYSTMNSKQNVPYNIVYNGINILYPLNQLEKRNSVSRTDGYWPYFYNSNNNNIAIDANEAMIQLEDEKSDISSTLSSSSSSLSMETNTNHIPTTTATIPTTQPPKQYTYGEFDFHFFAQLLDIAYEYYQMYHDQVHDHPNNNNNNNKNQDERRHPPTIFTDLGSGTGRLVYSAAALYPNFMKCRGIEILPSIHQIAMNQYKQMKQVPVVNENANKNSPFLTEETNNNNNNNISKEKITATATTLTSSSSSSNETLDPIQLYIQKVNAELAEYMNGNGNDQEEEEQQQQVEGEEVMTEFDENKNQIVTDQMVVHDIQQPNETPRKIDEINMEQPSMIYTLPCPVDPVGSNNDTIKNNVQYVPLSSMEFICGSFDDPYVYYGDSDIIFVYSSCMDDSTLLSKLACSISRQCQVGTIIITTDYTLPLSGMVPPISNDPRIPFGPYQYQFLKVMNGYSWLTGGTTTAYIHQLIQNCCSSCNDEIMTNSSNSVIQQQQWIPPPWTRPKLSLQDIAYNAIKEVETNQRMKQKAFIRTIYNDMIFHNIPIRFWPISMKEK